MLFVINASQLTPSTPLPLLCGGDPTALPLLDLSLHDRPLLRSEEVHTAIVGVIHEVVDGVPAGATGTGVLADRAAIVRGSERCVGDTITQATTTLRKNVIKPEVVARFVCHRPPEVVRRQIASREGARVVELGRVR